jgi:hypothetical protein
MNKFLAILSILFLTACSSTVPVVSLDQRTDLGISNQPVLNLDNVQFKVFNIGNVTYVGMTLADFDHLSMDFEMMQDRLQLDYAIINIQEQYYTAPLSKSIKK